MKRKFFSHLRYSFGNEDWRAEEEALDIQPEDHVLCITASGDRPLNLLVRDCRKIVSLDANPVQNHLLQLKSAAMQALEYDSYLAFLGAVPCSNRRKTLEQLLPLMHPSSAAFWSKRLRMISKGIIYQGAVERLLNMVSKVLYLFRGKKITRLFAMNNIEEQRKFVREEWESYFLRKALNIALNTFVTKILIEDPGLSNYSSDIKPGNYIYDRIIASLDKELAKKSPLLSLLFRGKVSKEAFSPYLTEEGVQSIKPRLSNLEIQTTDILSYLESFSEPTFDVYSLSDVASYMSYSNYIRLLNAMIKTAKPGARFCLRQFMSGYEIPENLQPFFVRDKSLEKRLERLDNCFVYNFTVGSITTNPVLSRGAKKKHLSKV